MKIHDLIENRKKYFGTYSVMALCNAVTVLDHIQKVLDIDGALDLKNEDLWKHPVMKCLQAEDTLPEKRMAIMEKLQFYFPFLRIMCENQRMYLKKPCVDGGILHDVLENVLRVVKTYRDITTHLNVESKFMEDGSYFLVRESKLANIVQNYYTVALRNTAERYSYTTKQLAFIQNNRINRQKRANTDFFLSLVCNGTDNKLHLSGVGVALLISLFLDKQYIHLFLTHLPIFDKYNQRSEERRIILRSMGVNSIVLPKDRIHSDKDMMSLAMDMLGELKRCPRELFDTLSPIKQNCFRIISTDHNEVLMRRSADRFAQLLMQYIDYGEKFHDIRFHVNMGKLRYLFNDEKHCIDGQTRVRVLEHPLNGFGRLADMEQQRRGEDGTYADTGIAIRDFENVHRDDANPANYPYVVDTYTHYILENNKVEMCIGENSIMPKVEHDDNGKWYVVKTVPMCRMSILELPAMAFHMQLLGSEKTEQRIKETYNKYMRLFKDMQRGLVTEDNIDSYGIGRADLPAKVLESLDGSTRGKDVDAYIEKKVTAMLNDTIRRIERLKEDRNTVGSKENKMGKRGFRQISTGKIADWLASDIVMIQPTAGGGADKMTGLNYRIMQAAIATYDSNGDDEAKNHFKEMFDKAHLLGADAMKSHPFLRNVFAHTIPEDAVAFYATYLSERKSYLSGLCKKIAKGKKVTVPFINRKANKWNNVPQTELGNIYGKDLAVELPRQMFDADIKECLKTFPQMEGIDFNRANVTYLIAEYLKRINGDEFQIFYSWNRNYRYMDMLLGETDRKGAIVPSYTSMEERERICTERSFRTDKYVMQTVKTRMNKGGRGARLSKEETVEAVKCSLAKARNDYQKSEKIIRRYKVQDALLFMMSKSVLTDAVNVDGKNFKLNEVMPDSDKGILSMEMPMAFTFERNGRRYTITSDGMKLKNYGNFFPLAGDKRLPQLMQIVGTDTVRMEELSDEFDYYNQCRPQVTELVFDLERYAFDVCPELSKKLNNKEMVQFGNVLQALEKNVGLSSKHREVLQLIRNAFEHNNYPENTSIIEITTLPEVARNLKQLFEDYIIVAK